MPTFSIYSESTGRIIKAFTCLSQDDLLMNVKPGQGYIEGQYDPEQYRIIDGIAVELPAKPDYPAHFDYDSGQWVWDDRASWRDLRAKRDKLLAASDWTQVPDAPVDQQAWATYRQALRDLPANTTDPRDVAWPEKP